MHHHLTTTQRRFLKRVDKITVTPWTGKIEAVDRNGKTMRLGKAAFQALLDGHYLIRSDGTLTTNTYTVLQAVLDAELEIAPDTKA